jgi:hypothetical protein
VSDQSLQQPPTSDDFGQPPTPSPVPPYPVSFEFDGPENLSRLSTFFRLIVALPLLLFLAVIGGASGGVLGGLVLAYWLSALVRKGRPVGWIGSAIVAILRFHFRAYTYLLLLSDKYPAFEGDWFAQLEADRPERISRRQIFFWKTFALVPHFICLTVLWFAVAVCEVIGWFAILFTGRFPKGLRDFVVGWLRWSARATFYWISLRDEFPPYSLSSEASAGSKGALRWSALGGVAAVVLIGVGFGATYAALSRSETAHVSYARLTQGRATESIEVENVQVSLLIVDDNYDFPDNLLIPDDDSRLVFLEASIANGGVRGLGIDLDDFELRDYFGDKKRPQFVSVGGVAPPAVLGVDELTLVVIVFEVEGRDYPTEFRYDPSGGFKNAKFIFDP